MVRTALSILSGNAAASLVLLVRNLLIARLIPVADYGVAATFAIVVSLLEMASALGLQQQIVQSRRGDDPHFQAALQCFQLLRGLLSGAIFFLLSGPAANFMDIPEAAWAYQVLAVIPVLNALQHFDIHRLNREMSFGPLIATSLVPALASLAFVWPLVLWFGDWQVMLWALVVQALLMAIVSHLTARRRWQLRFDRGLIIEALHFGWPLLLNSLLLFAVFNGDRVIVAREIGPEALGIFSMGVTLTLTPTLVLAKTAQSLFLPQFTRAGTDTAARARIARVTFEFILAASIIFVIIVFLAGESFVIIVLGDKYSELASLMTLFAVIQSLRILKAGPSIAALADGRTANALIGNIPRVATLPIIVWIAATSKNLEAILLLAAAGELVGFIGAVAILGHSAPDGRRELITCYALGAVSIAAVTVGTLSSHDTVAGLVAMLTAIGSLIVMRSLYGFSRT